ncbi:alpha/beta hydrolase fold protein [Desulfobulbus propionicus DSM 2032]|uniref:Alpha/beta hydrolase fold protein n=1 Tax=Desulfobulbus propionicus (strain ATCC 33891 / DSM 2032 / VKM B-1956 / 1pr3) TaxID=577650 RepID=A0A7U3YP86_DESPD|nr:hydrolase [Desulfobulbus propionicus]ADW19010.1 alpha/beta hydrolase fold protein [Desulfobulbus propionicus DSM 2032]
MRQPPPFLPPPWLRNPHLQTLWPKLLRKRPALRLRRERIELADGDFIDLAWTSGRGPTVLMLHGLEGTLRSHYALPVMASLLQAGFQPVFMHLRGCSGEPNRLPRTYHSGAIEDLAEVLAVLRSTNRPVAAAIGFSLGGNLLLRYLGTAGPASLLQAAMAVSVPFVLGDAARRLEQGGSRIYQHYLLDRLKRSYRRKFAQTSSPLRVDLDRIHTLREYDQQVTAPLNGFAGADDYYRRCSSFGVLDRITTPTLILHSVDDPFMYPHSVPEADQVGPGVRLAIQPHGGHVGFVDGRFPWRTGWLIDRLAIAFFREQLLMEPPDQFR